MQKGFKAKFIDIISFYGPFKAILLKHGCIILIEAYRQVGKDRQIYFNEAWRDIKYWPFKPLLKNLTSLNSSDAVAFLDFIGEKHINSFKIQLALEILRSAFFENSELRYEDVNLPRSIVFDFLKSQSYNVHGLDSTEYIDFYSDAPFR